MPILPNWDSIAYETRSDYAREYRPDPTDLVDPTTAIRLSREEAEHRRAEALRAQAQAESSRRQEGTLRQRILHDAMCAPHGFNHVAKPIKPKDSQEVQELKDQVNHLTDLVESLFKRLESIGILKEET